VSQTIDKQEEERTLKREFNSAFHLIFKSDYKLRVSRHIRALQSESKALQSHSHGHGDRRDQKVMQVQKHKAKSRFSGQCRRALLQRLHLLQYLPKLDDSKSPRNPWMSIFKKVLLETQIPAVGKLWLQKATNLLLQSVLIALSFCPIALTNNSN